MRATSGQDSISETSGSGHWAKMILEEGHRRAESGGPAVAPRATCSSSGGGGGGGGSILASASSSASSSSSLPFDCVESGNKCGKCQNHEVDVSKKGESRGAVSLPVH